MFELIQMTAAYSNAVLLVVLTNVTDVAAKLNLPIIRPVERLHVSRFVCDPRKNSIGGWLTLTNGYDFWFQNGHMWAMDSPRCYFHLQDPDEIPRFFGTVRMNEAEVIQMAQATVQELGYNPEWLKTQKPVVRRARTAPSDEPNVVPHIRVTWNRTEADGFMTSADVEINADAKRVEMYELLGRVFWRKQPDILQPPVVPKADPPPTTGGQRTVHMSDHLRPEAMKEVLAKVTETARKLSLPLKLPVGEDQLKEASLSFWQEDLRAQFILTNGYRFHYHHGHVTSFYAPDSESNVGFHETLTNLPPVDTRKLYGKVRYTKEQIREFAMKQVRNLGYPASAVFLDQPAFVYGGPEERNPGFARFYVRWDAPGTKNWSDPNAESVLAEVDGVTLELKSLWLRSASLRKPSIIKPDGAK